MNLDLLFAGSYINWEGVAESFAKRTIPSRLFVFAARRYLSEISGSEVTENPLDLTPLVEANAPSEVVTAVSSVPRPESDLAPEWGRLMDAAFATELELVQYGERPPLLAEVRQGLEAAVTEAADRRELARWFEARRDALPGYDLPEGTGYLPV